MVGSLRCLQPLREQSNLYRLALLEARSRDVRCWRIGIDGQVLVFRRLRLGNRISICEVSRWDTRHYWSAQTLRVNQVFATLVILRDLTSYLREGLTRASWSVQVTDRNQVSLRLHSFDHVAAWGELIVSARRETIHETLCLESGYLFDFCPILWGSWFESLLYDFWLGRFVPWIYDWRSWCDGVATWNLCRFILLS